MTHSPVLAARELRWQTRLFLAGEGGQPLLTATLRAPHALRQEDAFHQAFFACCARLEQALHSAGLEGRLLLETRDAEGPARHYAVADARAAKQAAIRFEETQPGGALLDLDVMDMDAKPLSRADLGLAPRACAVCGARPAAGCIAGRAHDSHQTEAAFRALLPRVEDEAARAARLALLSLLYEVSVTPKPGLVDRADNGAHDDMDFYTFLRSAAAIAPYFARCAALGQQPGIPADALLGRLRPLGLMAEQAMARQTGGVNTHKGLIFSLGILCAAAGRLGEKRDAGALCALAGQIAQPALEDAADASHGARVRQRYGDLGARGEAAAGFPSALAALPVLREAMHKGEGPDRAGARALLALIARVRDTNVLYRAGEEGLTYLQQGANDLLARDIPPEELAAFSRQVAARGISPGGSADLLAVAFFLHLYEGDA
ncbi:MAG: hypothetical protein GX653_01755 [Clostridiales bacterium]|nr:hypothetical protein [Clostridiales bacterium]